MKLDDGKISTVMRVFLVMMGTCITVLCACLTAVCCTMAYKEMLRLFA